uniref:Coatomer subunit gamma-2 n=1 Tax=Cyanistes caeruleus TaxID=156563 RepID=A0A8C0U9A6_CYACU
MLVFIQLQEFGMGGNHGMVGIRKNLQAHPVPPPAVGRDISHYPRLLQSLLQPVLGHFQGWNNHISSGKSLLQLECRANGIKPKKVGLKSEIKPQEFISNQSGIKKLQLFCSSPKPVLRYAAVRTLNKVAMKHPSAVTACNLDLENLITDSNRSIATLAITTLLKTGSESSVDRLMKQISSFVSEISDEFKVVVVQAISALCQKYPRKHSVMMTFLSNMLRDDGGFEYKRAIVDCIIGIIEENPESKESGLAHLCEFIEDCEHTVLATKILHLLGKEGPRTPAPSKYIRFIFNRVVLENEAVRAAAVSALAKFGAQNENLLPSILVLLQRCMMDSDDEVRDRATFYLNVLQQRQLALNAAYIFNGLTVSVPGMEKALHQYTLEPSEKPFDMKTVPLATAPICEQKSEIALVPSKPEKVAPSRQDIFQGRRDQGFGIWEGIPGWAGIHRIPRSLELPKTRPWSTLGEWKRGWK